VSVVDCAVVRLLLPHEARLRVGNRAVAVVDVARCHADLQIAVAPGALQSAQDWAQWRGPNRDGVVPSLEAPAIWPERLTPGWKVTVGIGHSSPVVVADAVFVHARQDEREVVSAFNLTTGTLLWQDRYDAPYSLNPAAAGHGKGPKSTPVAANGRLYTLGITEILSCYDITAGKLIWRKDFSDQFKKTSPDFGTAIDILCRGGPLKCNV
jgi:outer membrane protein assembly factor BamB